MKQTKLKLLSTAGLLGLFASSVSAATINVGVDALNDPLNLITTDTTWTSDNVYILKNIIYVTGGATLTIQPGTVIKGEPRTDLVTYDPGTLVITRDGTIIADGTPANPIIFTSTADTDPKNAPRGPGTSAVNRTAGEWGSLILLGRAPVSEDSYNLNNNLLVGTDSIEGLPAPTSPTSDSIYGGNDPHDSSGIVRYVQLRHGGTNLAANNEINGLTLGGIGDGTLIDYVEVYNNLDDGFEFFGGTANAKHLVALFCDDDSLDWDEGFSGQIQYFLGVEHQVLNSNRGIEADGDDNTLCRRPYAVPTVFNATWIGGGHTNTSSDSGVLVFRDNSGGKIFNSIITEYDRARAISIQDVTTTGVTVTYPNSPAVDKSLIDSRARLEQGDLVLRNNTWWNLATTTATLTGAATTSGSPVVTMTSSANAVVGARITGTGIPFGTTILSVDSGTQITLSANATATGSGLTLTRTIFNNVSSSYAAATYERDLFDVGAHNNNIEDPVLNNGVVAGLGVTRDTTGSIFLKPFNPGATFEPATGAFLESVSYRGAFDPSPTVTPWVSGWSVGSQLGYYAE